MGIGKEVNNRKSTLSFRDKFYANIPKIKYRHYSFSMLINNMCHKP